ncbi:MAG: argininosuccinate lyase [Candidatus Omnitrophica bacterium]|nr:argininosuccinate lyase [Candidatus Omnitrophota bacterium]
MTNKLWGGRFKKKTDKDTEEFLSSFSYDIALAAYDCMAGLAHVKMLAKTGMIKAAEKKALLKGLNLVLADIKAGKFDFDEPWEDVHTYVQQILKEKVGDVADKLHIARSRNGLVSADTRLLCKTDVAKIITQINNLQKSILASAKDNKHIVMPGYTHMKHAQPVLYAHYMLAYMEMLERDKGRLANAIERADASPLGVGAICGSSLHIDREMLSDEMGFSRVMQNSIDAVSDRDFVLEILAALSILSMHLSRLSEDFIIFSSDEFNFLDLDEAFCTGSSMMPHKKNPDALELIRGESAEVYGNLMSALTMMKGLPLSYNRDMQLDKKFLFNSLGIVKKELPILEKLIRSMQINKSAVARQLADEFLYATDISEYLMKKGLSHSQAHEAVGKLVFYCLQNKERISQVKIETLKGFSNKFDPNVYQLLNGTTSVRFKYSAGGTSPVIVMKAIRSWEKKFKTTGK